MEPIRVLIADDHRVYREGVRVLLQELEEVKLIGEAADGDQAISETERLLPDVILMDLRMPGVSADEKMGQVSG